MIPSFSINLEFLIVTFITTTNSIELSHEIVGVRLGTYVAKVVA